MYITFNGVATSGPTTVQEAGPVFVAYLYLAVRLVLYRTPLALLPTPFYSAIAYPIPVGMFWSSS